jgi:superfamily II DNA or RNA helicase
VLTDEIGSVLSVSGGLTAAELAERLGAGVEEVSFALYAGHGRFRRDSSSPPQWWVGSPSRRGPSRQSEEAARTGAARASRPRPSSLLGLYSWQLDALEAWERNGGRGVIEAVTGTGKTMVGVAAALDELARRGQVVVLVPTVELQRQWLTQLEVHLPAFRSAGQMGAGTGDGQAGPVAGAGPSEGLTRPLPRSASALRQTGSMGAGGSDSLVSHDVLVAVVNSARAKDLRPIRRGGLLVADECHRYGSAVNQLALDPRFGRRLGLSATYAREDDGNLAWLDPYFGGTCFRLGYERAVADGIVARFSVTLVGVQFSPEERATYEELTKLMGALRARLVGEWGVPEAPFEVFFRAVCVLAASNEPGAWPAREYRHAMLERRRLLADTPAKDAALCRLAPVVRKADRALVFTQSISAAERARAQLAAFGLRAAAMHSGLPARARAEVFDRFATGGLDVLAAPRVLDEGVDIPAADLAVILGASRSRRQMVQRMGRVLRRKAADRQARFVVVFVEDTVEDPSSGAHETFLEEAVKVAECLSRVRVGAGQGAFQETDVWQP